MRVLVPNLITLLSLCAGLTAIRLAIEGKLEWALGAIVFAAMLDGVDGRVARLLKGQSKFGAELDSLADFVNFGVVPGLILYFWGLNELARSGLDRGLVFAICMSLRLARFNVMADDPNKPVWAGNFFTGVPAPAGAIIVLLPIYLNLLGTPKLPFLAFVYTLFGRVPAGLDLAGLVRQAARQARAAGNGAAGLCGGGAVRRAACELSVGCAHDRHACSISPRCRSAGSPIATISARTPRRRRRSVARKPRLPLERETGRTPVAPNCMTTSAERPERLN